MKLLPLSVLLIGILVLSPVFLSDVSSSFPEDADSPVIVHTFKSRNFEFVLSESSSTAYRYVEIFTFYGGTVQIYQDDVLVSEYVSSVSGTKNLMEFSTGSHHTLKVICGPVVKTYDFNVAKNISLKDIDPDSEEIFILTQTELTSRIILYCVITFVCAVIGIYSMYFYFRRKASQEVRPLV